MLSGICWSGCGVCACLAAYSMEAGVASPIVLTGHPPVPDPVVLVASVLESAVLLMRVLGALWKKDAHPDDGADVLLVLLVLLLALVLLLVCLTGHPDEALALLLLESVMFVY